MIYSILMAVTNIPNLNTMLIKRVAEARECFLLLMNILFVLTPCVWCGSIMHWIKSVNISIARLGGSRKGRCGSIVLSVFRRVSRQADRRGRSRTVWWSRREMMVFPALARMVEFWWNGNALRTCEPGRRKGLGWRSVGGGIGAVNRDETEWARCSRRKSRSRNGGTEASGAYRPGTTWSGVPTERYRAASLGETVCRAAEHRLSQSRVSARPRRRCRERSGRLFRRGWGERQRTQGEALPLRQVWCGRNGTKA